MDLGSAMILANNPPNKLQNGEFRNFLQFYSRKGGSNEATLRMCSILMIMMKNISNECFLKRI